MNCSHHEEPATVLSLVQNAVPRPLGLMPPFLTAEWFAEQGIADADTVLAAMRLEDEVTTPKALEAIKSTRLSFARTMLDRMIEGRWRITLSHRNIDGDGVGYLIYDIDIQGHRLHFGAYAAPSQGIDRAGRLSDQHFDFYGALRDGPPDVPRTTAVLDDFSSQLWASRTDGDTIGFTIANRSVRNYDHAVGELERGGQPDPRQLMEGGGYVLRNAGWYGNGRQGTKSWRAMASHPLGLPYHPDMFALYLWRLVSFDVLDAAARARNPNAASLSLETKNQIGVGNSSGMGMVAALVRWPEWFGAYNFLRELSLAYATTRTDVGRAHCDRLIALLARAQAYFEHQPPSPLAGDVTPRQLVDDLGRIVALVREYREYATVTGQKTDAPWRAISVTARKRYNREAYEQLNSLLIELYPDFASACAAQFAAAMNCRRGIDPTMPVGTLLDLLRRRYAWALALDLAAADARKYFWYRSEESGETRRGERAVDPGVENETFVDVVGAIQALAAALSLRPAAEPVGKFLLLKPEFSPTVSRAQFADRLPYTEIRANVIDRAFRPSDVIRFLLSTMGLAASRPNNERYVRGVFMQGAPLPEDVASQSRQDWIFPAVGVGQDAPDV
jgi:hypothetical protein